MAHHHPARAVINNTNARSIPATVQPPNDLYGPRVTQRAKANGLEYPNTVTFRPIRTIVSSYFIPREQQDLCTCTAPPDVGQHPHTRAFNFLSQPPS